MEELVMDSFWRGKKVLITGNTGFKGSWLSLWLLHMGASVYGYALEPSTEPSIFKLLNIENKLTGNVIADIRNPGFVLKYMREVMPEILIHMAAQPLVRDSYQIPAETYMINVMGTIYLLEAARQIESIRSILIVTTDKCYENNELCRGYKETDPLGGYDPYSSSKACAEIAAASWRNSFFNPNDYGTKHNVAIATARAGNVIGGGDWAKNRLIPDCIRSLINDETIILRNPHAVRPWQHVLEPLSGYLILAKKLYEEGFTYGQAWNFGPKIADERSVEWVTEQICRKWWKNNKGYILQYNENQPHETNKLKLDCSKTKDKLQWQPRWDIETALTKTVEWTKAYVDKENLEKITIKQINEYAKGEKNENESAEGKRIREQILNLVKNYYKLEHVSPTYRTGDPISYGGREYDEKEIQNLVSSSLDFWLTAGPWSDKFETEFCKFLGINYCSLTNSGSSANLLAFMALTSHKLGNKRIFPGDEIITTAAGFPTTVTPIIQYGAVPVFIDITLPTYNIDINKLEMALSRKTKAVMLAHTLGNPFDIKNVKLFCEKNNLWLIEDNCDSLGSEYCIDGKWQYTGTFGDIGTSSFYPPHHITMGEGGAVYTNNIELKKIIDSMRDWGRDCWCKPGHDNTCGNRFDQQFGELPYGYDHKYVYSHFGYNLKLTDMQAAVGCAQLKKLPNFIKSRRENWKYIANNLQIFRKYFILPSRHRTPTRVGLGLFSQ